MIFCEPGFYRMIGGETNLLVECRENAYMFGNPGEPVLAMAAFPAVRVFHIHEPRIKNTPKPEPLLSTEFLLSIFNYDMDAL